jgi:cytochrome P450
MTELFNPHSNDWLLNKFEIYKELRAQPKAYWSEKYQTYIITRYDDVMFALSNPEIFSSAQGNLVVEIPRRFGNTLGASDNPRHDFFKNIVKNAYGKENISRVLDTAEPYLLEMISDKDQLNLSDIIENLSSWIVAEILNVPYDKSVIQKLILGTQRHGPDCVSVNVNPVWEKKLKSLFMFFVSNQGDHIPSPGPGIYHEYITNNINREFAMSLFVGPTVSGASSMTGGLEFLALDLYRQGQLERVYKDRSLIPLAVNESLRFNASTGRFRRTVTKEIRLHGVDLKPGDAVVLSLESANRDPDKFERPDEFILERNTAGVAFGHGVHACIALAISKAAMGFFINSLLDNFGMYRVTTRNEDLQYVMTQSGNDDMISNIQIERA